MEGYAIFIVYTGILLFIVGRTISCVKKESISSVIFADRKVGGMTGVCSVFAAWMWTTSVFGASETYYLYGIWGPVGYTLSACIAFVAFVNIMLMIKSRMYSKVTYLDYVETRYGKRTKIFFYMFAVIVSAYVLIEQAVGIAYILGIFYGTSFKILAFLSVIISVIFVIAGGMKSVLKNEMMTAVLIISGFAAACIYIMAGNGISDDFFNSVRTVNGHGYMSDVIIVPAVRYFIMAVVIAFSQLIFDPAFYIKADMLEDRSRIKPVFYTGGILLWGVVSLFSSLYLGWYITENDSAVTTISGGSEKLLFSIVMVVIGISTICHYLIGLFGIFSTDVYPTFYDGDLAEKDVLVFGKVLTVAVAIFCASIAISLENISLLTIDVFCAIFFAAPTVPIIIGCFSRRNFGTVPIISTIAGITGGLIVWTVTPGDQYWGQFWGMAASVAIPLILMMALGYFFRLPYDK